jgi:hypothetical protein
MVYLWDRENDTEQVEVYVGEMRCQTKLDYVDHLNAEEYDYEEGEGNEGNEEEDVSIVIGSPAGKPSNAKKRKMEDLN